MNEPPIKLNTVGKIGAGQYAGWYVVVVPKEDSYIVYICTDTTFVFNPAERECYDEWVMNAASLEGVFEEKYPDVVWDEGITPPQFAQPSERASRLTERLRTRMNTGSTSDENQD